MTKELDGRQKEDKPEMALLRLRDGLLEALENLRVQSEAYYYLCKMLSGAPEYLKNELLELIDRHANEYVNAFPRIKDLSIKAVEVCEGLARKAGVDRELDELSSEDPVPVVTKGKD